jgi:hypothetical protein
MIEGIKTTAERYGIFRAWVLRNCRFVSTSQLKCAVSRSWAPRVFTDSRSRALSRVTVLAAGCDFRLTGSSLANARRMGRCVASVLGWSRLLPTSPGFPIAAFVRCENSSRCWMISRIYLVRRQPVGKDAAKQNPESPTITIPSAREKPGRQASHRRPSPQSLWLLDLGCEPPHRASRVHANRQMPATLHRAVHRRTTS